MNPALACHGEWCGQACYACRGAGWKALPLGEPAEQNLVESPSSGKLVKGYACRSPLTEWKGDDILVYDTERWRTQVILCHLCTSEKKEKPIMTTIGLNIELNKKMESMLETVSQEYDHEELFDLLEESVKEKIKSLYEKIMDSE